MELSLDADLLVLLASADTDEWLLHYPEQGGISLIGGLALTVLIGLRINGHSHQQRRAEIEDSLCKNIRMERNEEQSIIVLFTQPIIKRSH